jgi:hypothetical protein
LTHEGVRTAEHACAGYAEERQRLVALPAPAEVNEIDHACYRLRGVLGGDARART